MAELVIRLVFSLAVVLGILVLLTRLSAKKFRGGADALVRVVHRQPLSRTSAVAVVTVGSRVLVIGTTEQQVQLLTELDPEELELPEPATLRTPAAAPEPVFVREGPEYATLDELFDAAEQSGSVDGLDEVDELQDLEPAYTPRHADLPTATRTSGRSGARPRPAPRVAEGALAGSVLSAQTWKQAFAAATSRTRDAS